MSRLFIIERARGGMVKIIGTATNEHHARVAFDRVRAELWRTFGDLRLVRVDVDRAGVEITRVVLAVATRVGRWSAPCVAP